MYRKGKWWGEFKERLDPLSCSTHLYHLLSIERVINPVILVALVDLPYCLALPLLLETIVLLIIIANRPYLLGDFSRPLLNHLATIFCLSLLLLDCLLYSNPSYNSYRPYSPLAILLALSIVLVIASYHTIIDIK